MMNADQWVPCWSQRQNALHVETLQEHAALNREACAANRPGDYRLLFVGTRAEVYGAADAIRQTLRACAFGAAGLQPTAPQTIMETAR